MDRLTFDGNFCDIAMCQEVPCKYPDTGCSQKQVWERLKAIEDILGDNYDLDRLRELVEADRDGRCVVLPCHIGDNIFVPIGRFSITGYEPDVCDGFYIARDGVLQIKARGWTGNHASYGVPGKTVFLTQEDAEAAIGGDGHA